MVKSSRGIEARSHGLAFLDRAGHHDPVDGRVNGGITQVLAGLDDVGLRFVVRTERPVVIVFGLFVIRVGNELLLPEAFLAGKVLVLVFVFCLGGFEAGFGRAEFGGHERGVYLGQELALFDHRIIIHVDVGDNTGYLRADRYLVDGFDGAGSCHGGGKRTLGQGHGVVFPGRFAFRTAGQNQHRGEEKGGFKNCIHCRMGYYNSIGLFW